MCHGNLNVTIIACKVAYSLQTVAICAYQALFKKINSYVANQLATYVMQPPFDL